MSDGAKSKAPKPPKLVGNKEHYCRLQFLYQAAHLARTSPTPLLALSRGYARNLDLVAKKTVLKLTPSMKQSMCHRCHTVKIPGVTMSVRLENLLRKQSPHNDVLTHKCLGCGHVKRYPVGANREFLPFDQRPGVKVEDLS